MIYITVFSMLYLSKYDLFHRSSVNILQDIQNFPNHCNKRLNPQRKFRSADSTGYLNRRLLKVNIRSKDECKVMNNTFLSHMIFEALDTATILWSAELLYKALLRLAYIQILVHRPHSVIYFYNFIICVLLKSLINRNNMHSKIVSADRSGRAI